MSRTDNTTPYRLRPRYDLPRYDRKERRWLCSSHHSIIADDVRRASRHQRRQARADLRRGVEPEPYRPRHRVQYDAI